MANVDNLEEINKIDPEGFLGSVQEIPTQCERAWSDWKNIALPTRFVQAKSILISGMGGSGIPGRLAAGLCQGASVPIVTWHDYGIPGWVNKDTLAIVVSVSGNTEETVDCLKKAAEKTDKIVTMSVGGDLEILSRKYKTTHYKINYTGMPRAAVGFTFTSVLAVLAKLKFIEIAEDDFKEAVILLKAFQKKIDANVHTANNNAKLLALRLKDKIPIIMGSGTFTPVARQWTLSFSENAKNAAYFMEVPEMNHYALVGLEMPKGLGQKISVIILQSKFDHPRIKIRQKVMLQIFQKRRIPVETVMIEPAPTPLSELLQMVLMGAYTSLYFGLMNDIDPYPIEMVDFLKDKLSEHPMEG